MSFPKKSIIVLAKKVTHLFFIRLSAPNFRQLLSSYFYPLLWGLVYNWYMSQSKSISYPFPVSILIVEDESIIALDIQKSLECNGYPVVGQASRGEDAVKKAEELHPDLILMDISLQGKMDGIEAAAQIREKFDLPVIFLTAFANQSTLEQVRLAEPYGYILKPFEERELIIAIEIAVHKHRAEKKIHGERRWLHAVLDSINDGVIALNDQGDIKFMNPVARELTGWSIIEPVGRTLHEVFILIDESSHERVEFSNSFKLKNEVARFEGLLQSKRGLVIPIEADINIIEKGNDSETGIVLVFRDITQHRAAMQEIRRQSKRAEALVETAARLNAQIELTAALNSICDVCNQALNANATGIFLQNTRQDTFNIMMTRTPLVHLKKFSGESFEIPGSVLRSILSEINPVIFINDIQSLPNIPNLEVLTELNIHTAGIAGMYRRQELIGVLISVYTGDPIHLPEDTLMLFKGLADQASISITNASLFEQVRRGREHQKELTTRLVEIQEIERRHIARELHDQIGQVLTGLQFMLEASKNQSGETYKKKLIEAQETVSGLIEQIREMSLNLRPAMLDDIGLLPTLLWHFERYTKQTGIRVSFHHNGITKRLSPNVETAVYRIIQEALTNIARHAQVTEAFVKLTLRNNILGVEIIDHGVGFDPSVDTSKWSTAGMAGMRERANMLGGYLVVKSAPNNGTQILAMISLDRKPVERRNHDRNVAAG